MALCMSQVDLFNICNETVSTNYARLVSIKFLYVRNDVKIPSKTLNSRTASANDVHFNYSLLTSMFRKTISALQYIVVKVVERNLLMYLRLH